MLWMVLVTYKPVERLNNAIGVDDSRQFQEIGEALKSLNIKKLIILLIYLEFNQTLLMKLVLVITL
jgi:hypothetical protein